MSTAANKVAGSQQGIDLSVVVPFYNEELALPQFVEALRLELDSLDRPYEVLFVNDGGTDGGPAWLVEYARSSWRQARVIDLTRNFGHMPALTAGMDQARGEWTASLDADLQHPPAVIKELLAAAESSGSLIAQAIRLDRSADSFAKKATAKLYYGSMKRLTSVNVPAHAADFRLLHRTVVDEIVALPERLRVYRLLLPWLGYQTVQVPYEVSPRIAGKSKYSPARMFRLALSSVTSFSAAPLRIATGLGVVFGFCGLLGSLYVLAIWMTGFAAVGWPSLMAAVLLFGGVQLLTIGILGEYVAEILEQVRGRPIYVVNPRHPAKAPSNGQTDFPRTLTQ